jgi:hypothetical protein
VQLFLSATLALMLFIQLVNPAIVAALRSKQNMTQYQLEIKKYDSTLGIITNITDPLFGSSAVGDNDLPSRNFTCTFKIHYSYVASAKDTFNNKFEEFFSRHEADTVTIIDKCSYVFGQKIKIFFDNENPANHYLEKDYRSIMAVNYVNRLSSFWYIIALIAGVLCIVCIVWMVITIKTLRKLKS